MCIRNNNDKIEKFLRNSANVSREEYKVLNTAKTLDEANALVQQLDVSKYRTSDLRDGTKYSYRCRYYRKYTLRRYEVQIYVPDNEFTMIKLMYKNAHCHEQRNVTGRLHSPIRESDNKYIKCQLTQGQIKNALSIDYPNIPLPINQLTNLINYTRRRDNPEIFSVYDFNRWCMNHNYDDNLLYSTFVPYYHSIKNIDDIFVFFTTKQLIQQIQFTALLQVDATDEHASCFKELFIQLQNISAKYFNRQYIVNYIIADGAPGITKAQQEVFPQAKRLMCWAHTVSKIREHRKLVPADKWNEVDSDIHNLQLCFSDNIFNCAVSLLKLEWDNYPLMKQFQKYFFNEWIKKIPVWYEGAACNIPSTNNGCESLNGKIKEQYTLRNKLHLSSFLPKIEKCCMLELTAFKWSNTINQIDILHWFGNWYIVPSSNPTIAPAMWLQMYQMQQWQTFNDFIIWLKSYYLVSPLHSCTCPNGMKLYICKHSFGLAMIFNIYKIKDKTRSELLGQRRGKSRSKKVKSALEF
ncbi:unnamed protein product [Rotaria socialis]|uniref:SWIM-type domain-containing protein n=1 Tax=Rotaria socialis TaxID=392032 RepID=A0A821TQT2_9BILA|nr:unnamed protein product [Rotaria socialis]